MDPARDVSQVHPRRVGQRAGFSRWSRLRHRADPGRLFVDRRRERPRALRRRDVQPPAAERFLDSRPSEPYWGSPRMPTEVCGSASPGRRCCATGMGRSHRVTSDNTLPDGLVTAMVRGRDGRLLLSSMGSGTMRERGGRFETSCFPGPAALGRDLDRRHAHGRRLARDTGRRAGQSSRRSSAPTSCRGCPTARSTACCRATTRSCGLVPTRASCAGPERRLRPPACPPRSPTSRRCRWSGIAGRISGSGRRRAGCCGSTPPACRRSTRATADRVDRCRRSSKIATAISGSGALAESSASATAPS